ncbi:hypothetical protein B0H63DRAFT_541335 [Podospora didyma]|uniref:Uncharacterized protein n=1 Tax=Podospora didyma TaxID=330526 RepID=A0AAE0NT43_9PEZI|nr:hypothetical protein B0H63DRAFT_541335 [Podospora didyma]
MPPKRKVGGDDGNFTPNGRVRRAPKIPPAAKGTGKEREDAQGKPTKRARTAQLPAAKKKGSHEKDDSHKGTCQPQKPVTVEGHLAELTKKSKEFMHDYKDRLAEEEEDFHEAMAKCKQDLRELPDVHREKMAPIRSELETKAKRIEEKAVLEKSKKVIQISHQMLKHHEAIDKESQRYTVDMPGDVWKQDEHHLNLLLGYGKKHGQKLVEAIINPAADKYPAVFSQTSTGMNEVEDIALGLFENSRKATGIETWGKVARAQLKALVGVAKTLPVNGDSK